MQESKILFGRRVKMYSTKDQEDIKQFNSLSDEWWKESGKFDILHRMNPARLEYIISWIKKKFGRVEELSILDIGCGGGIVSLPLARIGAKVLGIDAAEKNIEVALRSCLDAGIKNAEFMSCAIEDLSKDGSLYDVVIALEIIEHVENPSFFLEEALSHLKPGGLIFISTINRNWRSLLFAKICAEYVVNVVPIGTHKWARFIKPGELENMIGIRMLDIKGIGYSLRGGGSWMICDSTDINYICVFEK